MAFTDPFAIANTSTPSGATTPGANIDLLFRQLKTSLTERMNQILGGSAWGSDPVIDGTALRSIATIVAALDAKAAIAGAVAGRLVKTTSPTTIGQSSLTEVQVAASVAATAASGAASEQTNTNGTFSINLDIGTWLVTYRGNSLSNSSCTGTITVDTVQHSKVHSIGTDFCLTTVIVLGAAGQVDFGSTGGTGLYAVATKKINLA